MNVKLRTSWIRRPSAQRTWTRAGGRLLLGIVAVLALLASSSGVTPARAAVLRYALVVGTNVGLDADGVRRQPLHHAEDEAERLRDALLKRCGFVDGPRTQLLQRPTREALLATIRGYRALIAKDRKSFPDTEAMFLLYFSGHGADQSILLSDGPVTGRELVGALDDVGADLQIRIFDACSSASLDDSMMAPKGMSPNKLFHLIPELPDQSLNATGEVWFFSADEGETAFEHTELGSLFTHALLEALSEAPRDDFGISLDAIWEYARALTTELAAEQDRVQTPTRVSRMRTTGPLHLAWLPRPRATLVLGPEISGTLGLFYGGDQMLTIDKTAGTTLERAVYPGLVNIMVTKGTNRRVLRKVELAPGARVLLGQPPDTPPTSPFGRHVVPIHAKGGAKQSLDVTEQHDLLRAERDSTTVYLGAAYRLSSGPDLVASPRNLVAATVRVDDGPWLARAAVGYGFDEERFPSWSYTSSGLLASLAVGYGFDLGNTRLSPTVSVAGGPVWQRYGDGASQDVWSFAVSGGLAFAWAISHGIAVEAVVEAGGRYSPGVAVAAPYQWTPGLGLGVGLSMQLR